MEFLCLCKVQLLHTWILNKYSSVYKCVFKLDPQSCNIKPNLHPNIYWILFRTIEWQYHSLSAKLASHRNLVVTLRTCGCLFSVPSILWFDVQFVAGPTSDSVWYKSFSCPVLSDYPSLLCLLVDQKYLFCNFKCFCMYMTWHNS